ncbi:MFS general substrate transporter [Rickenella mellea]|uniref:MFS general substrate transporter n=1 Tax=Rickenella mellea TaxID=50990 RepID=A0A4Y7QK39_9AGAM|nr:MFS general substrate transporter [Rickenella mellea]
MSTGDEPNGQTVQHTERDHAVEPFSAFTKKERWVIVSIAAVAGIFSPLTSNIYLPAIPTIALAFHTSVELINVSVTAYMVVQSTAPLLWGSIADRYGRRPSYLACMLVLLLACIGLALVPTSDYWLLLILRFLQAAGSASTIALGSGTIADIATREERGGFFGVFTFGVTIGPCIGPVIGGALSGSLGWRAIFWFLVIAVGSSFCFILLFLPETLRSIVGDGSVTPPKWYMPLLPVIGRRQRIASSQSTPPKKPVPNPFRLLANVDVIILFTLNAVVNAVFYAIAATLSSIFEKEYTFLSQTDIGLCYLAMGGGMAIGSPVTGRLLDLNYRTIKKQMEAKDNADPVTVNDEAFPIEYARLRTVPLYLCIFATCCAGYGWSLSKRVHLSIPLLLQFIIGFCTIGIMNTTQTLVVDLFPTQGSSISGVNNLFRSSIAAALVSVIDLIVRAIGIGWAFSLLAGVSFAALPLTFWEMKSGPRWRAKRKSKEANRPH